MIYAIRKKFIHRILIFFLVFGFLTCGIGCARKGLVSEKYSRDFYHVPKLLPDGPMDKNPEFIVYGDSRAGWRFSEKFLARKNWLTWKMLIPFYDLYWLGNGVVGGVNHFRHVPDYGETERLMVRDAIYREARRSNVDFIIHGGDMPTDGRRPSHWGTFLRENKVEVPLLTEFPFLPLIGNHEKANDQAYGFPNYKAIFEYPRFYVLDYPDAAFFIVDSNLVVDQYGFIDDDEQDALFQQWFVAGKDSEQPAWLERELATRSQRFKIVVMHHPPVSFGRHSADWDKLSFGRDLRRKRQQLLSMLHQQGVQLVLASHDHFYEHNVVRVLPDMESEIHIVISGGGGAPLRAGKAEEKIKQRYVEEGLDVELVRQRVIYHYCLVNVAPDKITIRVMEVTGDPKEPLRLADEIEIGAAGMP